MPRREGPKQTPEGPTDLPKPSLVAVLKRSRAEFRNDNLTTLAAALTYYGVLAMVPGLLVLFTAVGFFGKSLTNDCAAGERGCTWLRRSFHPHAADAGKDRDRYCGARCHSGRHVVGLGICQRVPTGIERHLRSCRGPPYLEDSTTPPGRDGCRRRDPRSVHPHRGRKWFDCQHCRKRHRSGTHGGPQLPQLAATFHAATVPRVAPWPRWPLPVP